MYSPKFMFFLMVNMLLSTWSLAQSDTAWFDFRPSEDFISNEIALDTWLDRPAGKHGFVMMQGDKLVFEDETPVKFWGTNLASQLPFMAHDEAIVWANFLSRFGFNGVRFHKFTWEATDGQHSTIITPENWQNHDYLCNELRKKGIYYGWSHIYGHRVLPGDSSRLVAYSELAATIFPWSHLNGSTAALVNFAEDLQALNIELTVNMLNHVNPHTGLRYADDPALSFIEFQNEDNIFWGAIEETLHQTPAYRALLCQKFSLWLKAKYGTDKALRLAWNNEGLPEGESMLRENIYPQPNHGLFSWEYEQAVKDNRPVKQHILDKAEFLYLEQLKFYRKFESAIRSTGYKGPLVGSCWQAGAGLAHLLNLHADAEVGMIDRHNYFGGGQGHQLQPGKFDNAAMVSKIGSGLYGAGLQQVSGRPFAFSEWMSLIPNEWTAESSPIIAAYGLGLQGWDASYVFATDMPHYTRTIQSHGIYNATSPTQMALYPALSRMIYRGDIEEGQTVVNRKVDIDAMLKGATPLNETVRQDHDRKVIEGSFPLRLMAAGKIMLTFADENKTEYLEIPDSLWHDSKVTSTTGQLQWSEKDMGYFTINSPGTKGIVGFAKDQHVVLDELSFRIDNEFAVVLVSSLERDSSIANAQKILVTTVARAKNTGMKYNDDHTELLEIGQAPIKLEPVKLTMSISRKTTPKVSVLDHSGNKTGKSIEVKNGTWQLDGTKTETIYYLLEY
ncbi:MAG: hypothetical protein HC819_11120 [Cyclobacteriaceae bacterium]|nr:hypothetical protein [Cyclobacteriaceae bacterium]